MAPQTHPHELGKVFLESIIRHTINGQAGNFDNVLSGLTDIEAYPGKVVCQLRAVPSLCNRYGTLHGGLIATITDTVGSAALITQSRYSGVSLSISVDYLSPQPGGEDCEIIAQVVKAGKTIATVSVEIRHKPSGTLVALGKHVKFLHTSEKPLLSEEDVTAMVKRYSKSSVSSSTQSKL